MEQAYCTSGKVRQLQTEAKLEPPSGSQKLNMFSTSGEGEIGRFLPDTLDQGSAHGSRWVSSPHTPACVRSHIFDMMTPLRTHAAAQFQLFRRINRESVFISLIFITNFRRFRCMRNLFAKSFCKNIIFYWLIAWNKYGLDWIYGQINIKISIVHRHKIHKKENGMIKTDTLRT